jgi:hypothetical protein
VRTRRLKLNRPVCPAIRVVRGFIRSPVRLTVGHWTDGKIRSGDTGSGRGLELMVALVSQNYTEFQGSYE